MPDTDDALPGMPAPVVDDTPPDASRTKTTRTRKRTRKTTSSPATSADKPPRTRAPRPPRSRVAKADPALYGQKLLPLYALGAMASKFAIGDEGSQIVLNYAPMMARSWGPLAAENPAVRALIDKLTESSAVLGVVTAHLAVAGAVLAAKGKVPAELGMLAPLLEAMGDPAAMAAMFPGAVPAQDAAPAPTPPQEAAVGI